MDGWMDESDSKVLKVFLFDVMSLLISHHLFFQPSVISLHDEILIKVKQKNKITQRQHSL